jgi:hypothetical protein
MKKKSNLFNTVEFVKYKALVIQIVGEADWKKATALYVKRYKDYSDFRGGYVKLMNTVEVVKKAVDGNPDKSAEARAKHLNKTLKAGLNLLKADGFPKELGKKYPLPKEAPLEEDEKREPYGKKVE